MKYTIIPFFIVLNLITACGVKIKASSDGNQESTVAMNFFGQVLHIDDKAYRWNCTIHDFDFIMTSSTKCTEAKATSIPPNSWNVTVDSKPVLAAKVSNDSSTLSVNNKTYFCLQYSGSAYNAQGKETLFGNHTVLSSKKVGKPSQLQAADIAYIGVGFKSVCDALH